MERYSAAERGEVLTLAWSGTGPEALCSVKEPVTEGHMACDALIGHVQKVPL